MAKPDWKDAPQDAEYLAQDLSGIWSFHQNEPMPARGIWDSTAGVWTVPLRGERTVNPNWCDTLEKRP